MPIKIIKKGKKLSEREMKNFEDIIGSRVPEDYREFLISNNGCEPESNIFDIPNENNSSGINKFLSINEISDQKELLGERLVESAIPIAYAEGGNLVCMAIDEKRGKIYFWDHELEADENELPSWRNMLLLASSFNEFWNSLRKFNLGQIELKPDQVESAWIDPNLLEDEQQD